MQLLKKINKAVEKEFENYPLIKYLKLVQPSWTKVFAIKMIRKKNVTVNNKKPEVWYRLQQGDIVEITGINYKKVNKKQINIDKLKPLDVVYEDSEIIIVNKERGIDVQGNGDKHAYNNMNNRLLNHLKWGNTDKWKPVFVHRLDYNTTGLLIGAKSYKSYIALVNMFKKRRIHKYYKATVKGLIPFKEKEIRNYLSKEENRAFVVDKDHKKGKESISIVRLIKHIPEENNSLIEVKLITGRTHQIRIHMASIGHPIRGDSKYGIEEEKDKYRYPQLHAYKLEFDTDLEEEYLKKLKGKVFEIN